MYNLLGLFIFSSLFFLFSQTKVQAAQLSLSTENNEVKVDSPFEVEVNVSSIQTSLGTDVVIKYDPAVLDLVSIKPGTLYQDFSDTEAAIQAAKKDGIIRLSGVADFNKGTVANGVLGTLSFNALSESSTKVDILYDESDPTLSGVIPFEGNKDNLLTQAPQPLKLEIVSNSFFKRLLAFFRDVFSKN